MGDFVKPEPIRLFLSGGRYIDIKKRLNHGETEEMFARMAPFVVPGQLAQLDRREVRTARVLMYLLGWSLTNDGVPEPMSLVMPEVERLATIHSLDPNSFDEIYAAIETHEAAFEKELEAKKKLQATANASSAISPSQDAAIGAMSGSAN